MKISIIMAAYNSQATIGRAIESFLAQDHLDKELIIVDGASRDQTCAIVESFNSPLIHLHSERDNGIYDALNKGIGMASGAVLGLLHSNDFYSTVTVLRDVAHRMQDDALEAIYADVEFFEPGKPDRTVRHYRSDRFSTSMLRHGIMPAHPTLFLTRAVVAKYGTYRTDMTIAADFEYVARIFRDGNLRAAYVPETWIRMQTGGASTSGLRSTLTLNAEIITACRMHGIATSWPIVLWKYSWKIKELFPAMKEKRQ